MMKNVKVLIVIFLFIFPFLELYAQKRYEPGVILMKVKRPELVTFENGIVRNGSTELNDVFTKYQINKSRKLSHVNAETDGWYRLEYPINNDLKTICDELTNCPDVKYAKLNYSGIFCDTPNDTYWQYQWALQKIQMPNAWNLTKSDNSILVGILDTGLDYTHEDLADNIWINPNEIAGNDIDDDGNTYPDDIHGWDWYDYDNDPQDVNSSHGTRVAGVIAAKTYNSTGVAGIAGGWQNQTGVRLIGLRIGYAGSWYQDRAKEALDYLTWLRQNYNYTIIANMSFQTIGDTRPTVPSDENPEPIALIESINAAKQAGIILVAAAGNTINPESYPYSPYLDPEVNEFPYPARLSGVFAIGASKDGSTLQNEKRSTYSLYRTDPEKRILVVAPVDTGITTPNMNVYTTYPDDPPENYTHKFNGTSAACPITVGVISLMLTVNPSLTYTDISNILAATAEKIGSYTYNNGNPSWTNEVGYGRINAYEALKYTLENYGGTLSGDVVLHESLSIESGAVLIIEPGTTITFDGYYSIIVRNGARIEAKGTSSDPITFTSNTHSRKAWKNLYIYGSNNEFEYCNFEYGNWAVNFYGYPSHASGNVVKNCTFSNNDQGLRIENSDTEVYDCLIDDNRHAFVIINTDVFMDGNTAQDNERDGVYCMNSTVDMFNNTLDNNGTGHTSTIHGIWAYSTSDIALGGRSWEDDYESTAGYNAVTNNHGAGVYVSSNSYV